SPSVPGMPSQDRTLLFPKSATHNFPAAYVADLGSDKVAADMPPAFAPVAVILLWPITRSASAVVDGMVFQIRTRWFPESATNRRVPSLKTPCGLLRV